MTAPTIDLKALRGLAEKATPGEFYTSARAGPNEWQVCDCGGPSEHLDGRTGVVAEQQDYCRAAEDDAAFIAACVNYVRALLAAGDDVVRDASEIRLWDSQWVNVVNNPKVLGADNAEDAVAEAVKLTEIGMAKNYSDNHWPPPRKSAAIDAAMEQEKGS